MPARTPDDPLFGFCECRCGKKTNLARRTDRGAGTVKGRPYRFLRGHGSWGHVHSDEAKAKISAASRGKLGNAWRGDDILYSAAHHRHQKALAGQPCAREDATCRGRIHAALNHDTPPEFIKVDPATGLRYSTRAVDYLPLCSSHHFRWDFQKVAACPTYVNAKVA